MKEMKERLNEVISFYERRRNHQQCMATNKAIVVERQQERYNNGEISYEKLERAIKDKCIYDDFLRHTETALADLKYILEGER